MSQTVCVCVCRFSPPFRHTKYLFSSTIYRIFSPHFIFKFVGFSYPFTFTLYHIYDLQDFSTFICHDLRVFPPFAHYILQVFPTFYPLYFAGVFHLLPFIFCRFSPPFRRRSMTGGMRMWIPSQRLPSMSWKNGWKRWTSSLLISLKVRPSQN